METKPQRLTGNTTNKKQLEMKHLKNIGISKATKKNLKKQATERDVSYQKHCEDILERQAKYNTIIFKETPKKDPAEPIKESFIEPVAISIDFSSDKPAEVHNLKTGEKTILNKITPKLKFETGDKITPDEIKGAFARADINIYTNGKVWQFRRMRSSGLLETYYRTKDEAIKDRDKENEAKP